MPSASDDPNLRAGQQQCRWYQQKRDSDHLGEWGYSAGWPRFNEDKQGQLLARQWLTNVANEVPISIWYDWQDDGPDPNEPEHHFGVVANAYHPDRASVFEPKPAYLAAKTFSTFFAGFRFEKRLPTASPDDYVLVFRDSANRLRLAAWTRSLPHAVTIPLGVGQYTSVGHTGAGSATVSADAKGLSLTLNMAPVYLR